MEAIFTVAGIAIVSELVQKALEAYGHGDKAPFIKVAGYVACAFIVFDYWWEGIRYVKMMFGVTW